MTTMPDTPDTLHWSDAFLLGYGPMDATHEEFVACVQALQTCGDAEFTNALRAFRTHAESHFGMEKRWMEETEFPGRDCHIDEHAAVLRSVNEVIALLEQDPSEHHLAIGRNLTVHLVRWFPGHADHLDSALSHWMCKRSFGGKPVVIRRDAIGGAAPPLNDKAKPARA
jgi:hemerythrin-like metal-binding protein